MAPSSGRPRGRPRSSAAREHIIDAAYALLAESGYDGLAIETVAARARVAKTTIYKWWPDRASLAIEAFFERTRDALVFPESPSARAAFTGQIHALAATLRSPAGNAFAAMIGGARFDPAIRRAIGERWIAPRRVWGRERMLRAIANGECRAGLDVDAALSTLYSVVYAPLLLGFGVPDEPRLQASLDICCRGIFL